MDGFIRGLVVLFFGGLWGAHLSLRLSESLHVVAQLLSQRTTVYCLTVQQLILQSIPL